MQAPSEPKKGYLISEWGRQLVRYLRGERIIAVLGGRLTESPNGKTLIIDTPKASPAKGRDRLPFEIYTDGASIFAEEGIFCNDAQPPTMEAVGTDGLWYLQGKLVINATTGAFTSTVVEWVQTEGTDTSTDFHTTIGTIYVNDVDAVMVPDASSIIQYNYGTILGIAHGATDAVWGVEFF